MRFVILLLVVIIISASTEGLKSFKAGKKTKKTMKIAGEAGVGVASLTAAMAILNSIERSLAPEDKEMKNMIELEKKRLMGLSSSVWNSPWPYGGVASLVMLALATYIIRILKRRSSRAQQADVKDHGTTRVVMGRARIDEEKDGRRQEDECITVGEIQIPMKD